MDSLLGKFTLDDLRRRRSVKWARFDTEVLPAFVAEMDFEIARPIKEAVKEALDAGDCGYATPKGLGAAYASFASQAHGWAPDADCVYSIPDVMTGVAEVLMAVTPHGSGVVINPPVYSPYYFRLGFIDRRVVEAPLARALDGRYELDFEALEWSLASDGVAAYLLCSPHNPVGRVWSPDELATVAEMCARRHVALLVDEIHGPLALPGSRFTPILSLGDDATKGAFVFTSASKGWNIPGLKCGLAIAETAAGRQVLDERWEALLAAHVGVFGTAAAFEQGGEWLAAAIGQLDENRARLAELIPKYLPGAKWNAPEASFLAWIDCGPLGLGDQPADTFLERGRVALVAGHEFGDAGRGFVRLNFGTSPEILEEILQRMGSSL